MESRQESPAVEEGQGTPRAKVSNNRSRREQEQVDHIRLPAPIKVQDHISYTGTGSQGISLGPAHESNKDEQCTIDSKQRRGQRALKGLEMGTKPKNTSEKHVHPLYQLRGPH